MWYWVRFQQVPQDPAHEPLQNEEGSVEEYHLVAEVLEFAGRDC